MKTLIVLFLFIFGRFASATPITCAQLAALGYKYLYLGFTGNGPDLFTIAHSNDTVTWVNLGGSWPSCGNGSPCQVNSPSAVCYNNNLYLLIAEASDGNLNSTKQDIGILNTDYSVTTLLTFDWASLGGVQTIFAGRWEKVLGSETCFTSPVTFASGYDVWSTYRACASLKPGGATITSGPTLLTTTGMTMGYDPQVIQFGSTCTLVQSQTNVGNTVTTTALSTGNCPSGPFTYQTNGLTSGSPLFPQTSGRNEGPNYYQAANPDGWTFFYENLTAHQMYTADCSSTDFLTCNIPAPTAWTEDQTYRAGTIIRFAPFNAKISGKVTGVF